MNSIKAICFDFDGTLAEFVGDFPTYLNECFERLGVAPSPEFLQTFNKHLRSEGHLTSVIAFERTCHDLGIVISENLEPIYQFNVDAYAAQVKLLPSARALLEYFQEIPKAIITNGPSDMQWAAIHKVGIADLFKTIVVSGDAEVGFRKPNPLIFHLACERLGVTPQSTLMIGDNVEADIQGAMKAGLQALHMA
jgi:putative hydrolase of the HAD superfamily